MKNGILFQKKAFLSIMMSCVIFISPFNIFAFEAGDNDAFYLAAGSSNIEVKEGNQLLEGGNVFGGIRLGVFSWLFVEGGYGAITYEDTYSDGTDSFTASFRTTGPHLGVGIVIPIREFIIGVKAQSSHSNKWSETVVKTDNLGTETEISGQAGDISFDSYFIFSQFLERSFEVGIRRDAISENDSIVTNSFGVYFMANF